MNKVSHKEYLGVAVDIGTTDIKGSLMDISSERELAKASVPNEQKAFGQDVITRLHFATKKGGLKELNKRVISAVNKLLKQLAEDAAIKMSDIKKIVAVGNSTMYHLVLMIRPDTLARAPFAPAEKRLQERNADEMGIFVAKDAVFRFLPNISGFIGSDILATILSTGVHKAEKYNFIVDMGTNGEIALGSAEKIFVASCASGPAFEGRHIRCGMPAREGAIIHAEFSKGRLSIRTMGGIAPKGISGSGLIDIVSILLNRDIVGRKGKMKSREYVIYKRDGKRIFVTQDDIRELQLAKAAFASGIEILKRKAAIGFEEIDRFYITGMFGEGMDKGNAKNIGLIPKGLLLNKIRFLKDGPLSGAKTVLLERACEKEINGILAKCEHIELHKDREFEEVFAGSMQF